MQTLALSTSFTSNRRHTSKSLLDLLEKFNISGLELDYRINDALYKQIREALKQSRELAEKKLAPLTGALNIPGLM